MNYHEHNPDLYGFRGSKFSSSCLHGNHFSHWTIFSAPQLPSSLHILTEQKEDKKAPWGLLHPSTKFTHAASSYMIYSHLLKALPPYTNLSGTGTESMEISITNFHFPHYIQVLQNLPHSPTYQKYFRKKSHSLWALGLNVSCVFLARRNYQSIVLLYVQGTDLPLQPLKMGYQRHVLSSLQWHWKWEKKIINVWYFVDSSQPTPGLTTAGAVFNITRCHVLGHPSL